MHSLGVNIGPQELADYEAIDDDLATA
ncbi:unnamed protein product, partial [Allacma fusca]